VGNGGSFKIITGGDNVFCSLGAVLWAWRAAGPILSFPVTIFPDLAIPGRGGCTGGKTIPACLTQTCRGFAPLLAGVDLVMSGAPPWLWTRLRVLFHARVFPLPWMGSFFLVFFSQVLFLD